MYLIPKILLSSFYDLNSEYSKPSVIAVNEFFVVGGLCFLLVIKKTIAYKNRKIDIYGEMVDKHAEVDFLNRRIILRAI